MKEIKVNLSNYQEIDRRTTLLNVGKINIVAKIKNRGKFELYEISTMQDLQEVISKEQKRLYCDELTFFKQN